jgi:hypothetical protein
MIVSVSEEKKGRKGVERTLNKEWGKGSWEVGRELGETGEEEISRARRRSVVASVVLACRCGRCKILVNFRSVSKYK